MPLMRYFFFVGAALLALLFVSDAVLPKLPVVDRTVAAVLPVIRIHTDRKWPAAVVFDTSIAAQVPAVAPPQLAKVEAPAPVAPTEVRVRNALAQLEPAYPKKPEPKRHAKRKIAKARVPPPIVLAQQPRFGFFTGTW